MMRIALRSLPVDNRGEVGDHAVTPVRLITFSVSLAAWLKRILML